MTKTEKKTRSPKKLEHMSRAELKNLKAPPGTETWKPVEYSDLLNCIEEVIAKHNVTISKEEIAVQRGGNFLFCIMDLERGYGSKLPKTKEITCCMGIKSSYNKKIGIQIAVAARVIANDSIIFYGDLVVLRRKHTKNFSLQEDIEKGFRDFSANYERLCAEIEKMKGKDVSDAEVKVIIFDVFHKKILPIRLLPHAAKFYFEPTDKEFKGRNLWSLLNSLAWSARTLSPERKFIALKELGRLFSQLAGA